MKNSATTFEATQIFSTDTIKIKMRTLIYSKKLDNPTVILKQSTDFGQFSEI